MADIFGRSNVLGMFITFQNHTDTILVQRKNKKRQFFHCSRTGLVRNKNGNMHKLSRLKFIHISFPQALDES